MHLQQNVAILYITLHYNKTIIIEYVVLSLLSISAILLAL